MDQKRPEYPNTRLIERWLPTRQRAGGLRIAMPTSLRRYEVDTVETG